MFKVLQQISPGAVGFKLEDDMAPFTFPFDADKPLKFAQAVAYGLKKLEPFLGHLAAKAATKEDVDRIEVVNKLFNEVMADAFWFATKDINDRHKCGLINRHELIRVVESLKAKK